MLGHVGLKASSKSAIKTSAPEFNPFTTWLLKGGAVISTILFYKFFGWVPQTHPWARIANVSSLSLRGLPKRSYSASVFYEAYLTAMIAKWN
jgi:hypothetical protein